MFQLYQCPMQIYLFLYHISNCLDLKYIIFYWVNVTAHSMDAALFIIKAALKKNHTLESSLCFILYALCFGLLFPLVMAANGATLCLTNTDLLVKYATVY